MKVAVNCECEMLQTTLEMFLKDDVVPFENAEMVISDIEKDYNKPLFLVSNENGDLKLPFNKKELLATLAQYENILKTSDNLNEELKSLENSDFTLVEPLKENSFMDENDTKDIFDDNTFMDLDFLNLQEKEEKAENIIDSFTNNLEKAISEIKNTSVEKVAPPFTYAVGDSFDKAKERQISLLEIKIATLFNDFKNELIKVIKEEILK